MPPAPSVRFTLPAIRRRMAAALSVGAAAAAALAFAAPAQAVNPPGPDDPIGVVSHVVAGTTPLTVVASGWAADPDAPTANATVLSIVDGHVVARTATSIAKPFISASHGLGATPGFQVAVPLPDTGRHTVCIAAANVGAGMATVLGCAATPLGSSVGYGHDPRGAVSSATAGSSSITVTGWAQDPDFLLRRSVVVLYVDGYSAATVITQGATAAQRAAGAAVHGAFSITVPVQAGAHLGCLWIVNAGFGSNSSLGCHPVDTRGGAGTGTVPVPRANTVATNEALTHIGGDYVWGAEGPKTFDCSGLVQYSYGKAGVRTPRIAADQFAAAHLIPASRAVRGDLVFYHDGVGNVYHVGIYLSPGLSVAAIDTAEGINYQHIWDTTATYGSFTHT